MTGKGAKHEPVMAHDPLADMDDDTGQEQAPRVAMQAQSEPRSALEVEAMAPPAKAAQMPPELKLEPDMPPRQAPDSGSAEQVYLGESLSIQDVAETLETFRSALELGGTLRIAAGDLEQLDGAGLQLLCATVRTARAQAVDVVWESVSGHLRTAAQALGLDAELAL